MWGKKKKKEKKSSPSSLLYSSATMKQLSRASACESQSSAPWTSSVDVARARLHPGLGRGFRLAVHFAEVPDEALQLRVPPKLPDEAVHLGLQVPQSLTGVGERAHLLQVVHAVALDVHVLRALPQDVLHLGALRLRPDGVNGGERELALRQVLAEALALAVFAGAQVGVVVADLEEQAQRVQEGLQVLLPIGEQLHQAHRQTKEPSGFLQHHVAVLLLRGAGVGVPPVDVQALTAVELQQLPGKQPDSLGVLQGQHLLQPQEVDVVGGVDDGGDAVDAVGHREAPPQRGAVLDVVDEQAGVVQHLGHLDDPLNRKNKTGSLHCTI
ncbi:hypothetical protein EYF80_027122 [Liparis tanakae]|uniref:Uncharacterized protein n=1 Tax=Liparis tanakae TaxID=230148 RepID=A0A4Z2HAP0_9TELE|nr:hypothetical protein EYF80_027122 [Liparis tanakae]